MSAALERTMLLTPGQVAKELAISEKQLRHLTSAGLIRYINIGLGSERERRRYDPDDIERFREARKCQSISGPEARHSAMTSSFKVLDIQEIRKKLRSDKLNNLSTASGSRSKQPARNPRSR